jgi:hypothetical protein
MSLICTFDGCMQTMKPNPNQLLSLLWIVTVRKFADRNSKKLMIICVCITALLCEPYFWSIIMGFLTESIIISSKIMPEARLGGDPGQVLILTPFVVSFRVQWDTKIPLTSCSWGYLPRLPTLAILSTQKAFRI